MELRSGRLAALAAVAGMAGDWEPVPDDMQKLAQSKMRLAAMTGAEPQVNMHSQHPLAKWARVHRMSPGPDRWKERSRTYQGIADAMAQQWGSL